MFWCVCTTTEIAGILVRSTFAEALGHELAVKNHRKFWQRLKIFNPQFFFTEASKCVRPTLPNMKSQLPLRAENKRGKWASLFLSQKHVWTLLVSARIGFPYMAVEGSGIFRNFSKCIQLWWAVSPSSRNILWWDRYRCKDLCLSFQTSLIRSKTGTWRQSYSRYKIENFRKIAFTPPLNVFPVKHRMTFPLLE